MFIFVGISITANQNCCMRRQHFACVLALRRSCRNNLGGTIPLRLIDCPVLLKSLQPQLPLAQVCYGYAPKLFSLERGHPCECVSQQCKRSQQDEWNRGPGFISKLLVIE